MKVNNIEEYASYLGIPVDSLKRSIYKYTDCGAWIDWDDNRVTIGSIVEGSDAEFSKTFLFPVEVSRIDNFKTMFFETEKEALDFARGYKVSRISRALNMKDAKNENA